MVSKESRQFYDKYQRNAEARKFYNSVAWKRARATKLGHDPLCEICKQEGRVTPADMVHHIERITTGKRRLDLNFLVSLCHEHHNRVENEMEGQ